MTGTHAKSAPKVNRLVKDVFQAPDFSPEDLRGFDARAQTARLDAAAKQLPSGDPIGQDKWKCTDMEIIVPTREKNQGGNSGQLFSIHGLYYQPIMDVVRSVFAKRSSRAFHLMPFKKVRQPPTVEPHTHILLQKVWKSPITGKEQQVYDELYTSDTWNKAQDEIMKQRRTDNCKLERVIAGLMLWSDLTRLAQFRHASAWPIYLFFGNASKHAQATPEGGACHLIAFIPLVCLDNWHAKILPDLQPF